MQTTLHIDSNTTGSELLVAANYLQELAALRNPSTVSVSAPPADPAALSEPEVTVINDKSDPEKQTRRRRTKAEIEADKLAEENSKVADAEAAVQRGSPDITNALFWEDVAGNFGTLGDGQVPGEGSFEINEGRYNQLLAAAAAGRNETKVPAEAQDEFETVVVTGTAKTYTEAEVQALATLIARTKGANVVKDKIGELGGQRIAALTPEQLNQLGDFLEAQKAQ